MKANIWNKSGWLTETREKELDRIFDSIIKESGFTVVNKMEHEFYPFGYTALYLLSESHFAIHTFPEEKMTYYELSSCNKEYYDRFVSKLAVLKTHVERKE